MSAGFGIGFSRNFCPVEPLAERISLLQSIARETHLPIVQDFVAPKDLTDWSAVVDPGAYELLRCTRSMESENWEWRPLEELQELQKLIGTNWSGSGSLEDCFLICDEETNLILPTTGGPEKGCLSTGLPGYPDAVVYAQTEKVLATLRERLAAPELSLSESTQATLRHAERLLDICHQHSLPFYLAWS